MPHFPKECHPPSDQGGIMSFQKDLKRGLEVEEMVLSILRKKYPCASLINAFKGYDRGQV